MSLKYEDVPEDIIDIIMSYAASRVHANGMSSVLQEFAHVIEATCNSLAG